MRPQFSKLVSISILAMLAIALTFSACSKNDPAAPENQSPPANVNKYLATLPAWSAFSPPLADADVAVGDTVDTSEQIENQPYNCTTQPYSMTRTPDRVVTLNPDVEILWLGALLQGKGHLGGIGSLAELPVRQRAPLKLSIDLLTGDNSKEVSSPSLTSVTSAIGELIQKAQDAGHMSGSDIFFTEETAHSLTQAALEMGLSASYMGASIKASLSANISDETRTVTAYFVQRMFTVSMELPQTPGDVFSDAFTADMLQEQINRGRIGPDNPPVYVSSIAYGRILMFSFTSTASLSDIKGTLSALYNGGEFGGSLSAQYQNVLENAQIQVVTVGGDASAALSLIRSNDLGAYFTQDAPLTTAKPISYTVRNLGDNSIASVSETTTYNLKTCEPAEVPITGSAYTLHFTKWKVIDLPFIDVCGITTLDLFDCLDIELQYTIHVETSAGGVIYTLESPKISSLHPYAALLKVNELYAIPAYGGVGTSQDVTIHWDGPSAGDYVKVWGEARDWDVGGGSDKLPFSRTFVYPSKPMPSNVETYVDAHDSWGNKVRLYFTVTKGQDTDT
ncbi:MAG TPA: thiol-activated cytolysin family protein [Candidatus Krumholzibacteria bacterium]|nr:thiol-activated cytolysin family protein [Candidatus Krumholzibacteria bacterium]